MMKKAILIVVISLFWGKVHSQINTQLIDSLNQNVVLIRDADVDTLIKRIIHENRKEQKIEGYRIQIYSGSNHAKANKAKATFMMDYPYEKIVLFYQQPNFKVRVGNYRNRLEAMKMYHILLDDIKFRSVLLVPDKIDFPELKQLDE